MARKVSVGVIIYIITRLAIGSCSAQFFGVLGVPLGDNMKLYTRVGSEEVWHGYWNVVFSVLGNYGEFGDCGFELALQLGNTHLAIRKKQNGIWTEWTMII